MNEKEGILATQLPHLFRKSKNLFIYNNESRWLSPRCHVLKDLMFPISHLQIVSSQLQTIRRQTYSKTGNQVSIKIMQLKKCYNCNSTSNYYQ